MKPKLTPAEVFTLLDLTCLNEASTEEDIARLCSEAAESPQAAAVCVRPEWVGEAVQHLKKVGVKVATVANFPEGTQPVATVQTAIRQSIRDGAAEIDVVFPRSLFFAGDDAGVRNLLSACREAAAGATLKVILESGAFPDQSRLASACRMACECGADFLKTSTGRHAVGATLEAAATLLGVLSQTFPDRGIKISGGIRTLEQALSYIEQARRIMGDPWITPAHFRIGTSQLKP